MAPINILSIQRMSAADRDRIAALDPRIKLVDAGGWFDGEIRATWSEYAARRYLTPDSHGAGSRAERDRLLAEAEIVIGGWPFPRDLRSRAPRLKWFHQRQAGASNLIGSDLWGSDVVVTTSRGVANPLPIAEYAVAGLLHMAMHFNRAPLDRAAGMFDHRAYHPLLIQGKTACVVGAGGIGREVGRLCAALGMRVVGTRRRYGRGDPLPPGFSELGEPDALDGFLQQSDFVAVCCQWTLETTDLFDARRLAAMKTGSILVNVARGEIINEDALADALERGHLRGAVLDVYRGEFERLPSERLWRNPQVLITPHVSGGSDDTTHHGGIDLFCENFRDYVAGRPLRNVIDWQRGY